MRSIAGGLIEKPRAVIVRKCVAGIVAFEADGRIARKGTANLIGEFHWHVIVEIAEVEQGGAGDVAAFVEVFVDLCAVIGDRCIDLQARGGHVCQRAAHAESGDAEFTIAVRV